MTSPLRPVIGLEIHVRLATRTKLFCGDRAATFGEAPNTAVCPVCLGLPGSLPALNAEAVRLAVRAALALGCMVNRRSAFVRKAYLYPDLPKGYQITQREEPLATGGQLELDDPARTGTLRIPLRGLHLEEDSGRTLHDRFIGRTAIDFNRAGVPLIEIVTEPALRTPAEARRFLVSLRQHLRFADVSSCDMEKGELRVDANVSLGGDGGGTRVEIKNLNSFAHVEQAIGYELRRQAALYGRGHAPRAETRLWDARRRVTRVMRDKEEVPEYRYFPEPDLPPILLTDQELRGAVEALPEPPRRRAERLMRDFGLSRTRAGALTAAPDLAHYFEAAVAAGADAADAAGWILGELLAERRARGVSTVAELLPPDELATLLRCLRADDLPRGLGRAALRAVIDDDVPIARALDDLARAAAPLPELEALVTEVLREHPAEARRLADGDERLVGFFVGSVMRRTQGRADPRSIREAVVRRVRGEDRIPE